MSLESWSVEMKSPDRNQFRCCCMLLLAALAAPAAFGQGNPTGLAQQPPTHQQGQTPRGGPIVPLPAAPQQTAPGQAAPGQAAPVQNAPAQNAPAQAAPAQAVPAPAAGPVPVTGFDV